MRTVPIGCKVNGSPSIFLAVIPSSLDPVAVLAIRAAELARHHRGVIVGVRDGGRGYSLVGGPVATLRTSSHVPAAPVKSEVFLVGLRMRKRGLL